MFPCFTAHCSTEQANGVSPPPCQYVQQAAIYAALAPPFSSKVPVENEGQVGRRQRCFNDIVTVLCVAYRRQGHEMTAC